MKVLICVRRMDRGAAELLECRLAYELNRMGIETHLMCQYSSMMEGQTDAAVFWQSKGAPVHWLHMDTRLGILFSPMWLRNIVHKNRFDVVITSTHGTGIIASIGLLGSPTVHVVALHDYPIDVTQIRIRLWKLALTQADGFYSISKFVRDRAVVTLNVPQHLNKVVYNSIDVSKFVPQHNGDAWRKQHNLPQTAKVLLFIGRIQPRKGCDLLVDVFASVLAEWDAYLVMVGPSGEVLAEPDSRGYDKMLRTKIAESGVSSRIILCGYQADVREILAASDVLVHLPRHEGFAVILLEAIAMGIPIVTTDVGGIPEVLEGTPYKPIPISDHEQIRNATHKWLTIPDKQRKAHIEEAKQVLTFYNDERRAREILGLLESILVQKHTAKTWTY